MKNFPEFFTERLILRQIGSEDLDTVYHGLSHPDVIKYYGVSYNNKESAKEQLSWFRKIEKEGSGIWWAICLKDNVQLMGVAGFNNMQKKHRKAEIGYWLLPEYWGNGYILEVMATILNYGFDMLHLHRVEAFVETKNINSKKTLRKLGFIYEGTMIDCEIKNDTYISLDIYAKFGKT